VLPVTLQAQATVTVVEQNIIANGLCLNDGDGEFVSGTVSVNLVEKADGSFHANPKGGVLVGEDTGIIYHTAGATNFSVLRNGESFVNRFQFVGKGRRFYVKVTSKFIVDANGEVRVDFVKSDFVCK
jgi:hypothetical protein